MHASQGGLKVEVILPFNREIQNSMVTHAIHFCFPTNIIETRGSFLFS